MAKASKAAKSNITKPTQKQNEGTSRGAGTLKSPPELIHNPPAPASIPPAAVSASLPPAAAAAAAAVVASIPTPLPQAIKTTADAVPVSHDDDVEATVLADGDRTRVDAIASIVLRPLTSIWGCDMLNRVTDHKSAWHCSWCDQQFRPFHGTRAMDHVLKREKKDISSCTAQIRPAEFKRYVDLYERGVKRKKANKRARDVSIECTTNRLMVGLHGSVEAAAVADAQGLDDNVIDMDVHSPMSSVTRFLTPPRSIGGRTSLSRASAGAQPGIHAAFLNRSGQQSRTQSDIRVSNDSQLELAIAECWFTNNWSDRSVETDSFARIISWTRLTTSEFKIPGRNKLGGPLLKLSYKSTKAVNTTTLLRAAHTWGTSWMGDGATVKRMPLINVLGMSGNSHPVVVAVNDCTEHMAAGGKKDASYISAIFEDRVAEYDPTKEHTDLFFFDGASNVQKGGDILCEKYPRAYCLHAGEHVVALFFSDIAKLGPIKVCYLFVCQI